MANFQGFSRLRADKKVRLKNSLQTHAADYCAEALFPELHNGGLGPDLDRGFDQDGAALRRNEDAHRVLAGTGW